MRLCMTLKHYCRIWHTILISAIITQKLMSSTPHNRAYFHAHTTSHIWICSRFQTNSFLSSPINAIVVKVVVIRGQRWIIVWLSQNHKVATCPEFQNWFLSASRFPNSHYKWSVQRDAVNRRENERGKCESCLQIPGNYHRLRSQVFRGAYLWQIRNIRSPVSVIAERARQSVNWW